VRQPRAASATVTARGRRTIVAMAMRASLVAFVLGGAVAGWLVAGVVPPGLREPLPSVRKFELTRPVENPLTVSDAHWMFEPRLYGDFDLRMEIELGEGVDLDVLLRQVEPRVVGPTLLPFHGRFAVLRLSANGDGPGWRSRDDALQGPRGGGIGLAPGLPASVWIEGRGRQLTANVAGRPQPAFTADDRYGMLTLVARGGTAVVHSLTVVDHGVPGTWRWGRLTWTAIGAAGAVVLTLLARALQARPYWFFVAAGLAPLTAWLAAGRADLDLAFPAPWAMASMLLGSLALPFAGLARARFVLPAVVAVGALLIGVRALRHDTAAVDALFGPDAGNQLAEAHAQRVRTSTGGLITRDQPGRHVFLLGGGRLYDRGMPDEHLELLVARELRTALAQKVAVPCLPTPDGHTAQQWRLFTTFYAGYRPAVVVLGVPRDEMAVDDRTGERRSSPERVRATIDAARAWCANAGSKLLLFADSGLPVELQAEVQRAAADGVPTVVAVDGAAPIDLARKLAAALLPLLAP
jgi:hypothetical protein